jgi:hypothetical protein
MPEQETALLVPKHEPKPEAQAGKLSRLAAFTPVNLTEAVALSKLIASSELAPKDFRGKPGNVLIAMQMGAEVGLAPMQAIQNIAVINGRPSLWGDAALGVVQVHPDYEWHKEAWEGQGETRCAVFQIKRKGQDAHTTRFSVADAKKASLWGKQGPWQTYPDRMLQMRARGFGLRDKFADALRGLSIAEEAMDIAPESPGNKTREMATLDMGVGALTPSSEPNRGHNDTGLQRGRDEQNQPEPKKEPTICGDCGKVDSHEPTCKYFTHAEQDRRTSKGTVKALYLILSVEAKQSKKKQPYLVLSVVTSTAEGDKEGKLYVWNKALHGYLSGLSDKKLVGEVSEQTQGDSTFFQLEHIIELDEAAFVNDIPATQGTLAMPAEQKQEEDF